MTLRVMVLATVATSWATFALGVGEPHEFTGEYVNPSDAARFDTFIQVDPATGLLMDNEGPLRLFFTVYDQPKDGQPDRLVRKPLDYDYDLLELDLALMRQAEVNIYMRFMSWSDLLDENGDWRTCDTQPRGTGLPTFTYNYEVYDYFLDRAQAHGVYVNLCASLYWDIPDWFLPRDERVEKLLVYDHLWDATVAAYARIHEHFSNRKCVVVNMVGQEDFRVPAEYADAELASKFQAFLATRYGTVDALKSVWCYGYDYTDSSLWTVTTFDEADVYRPAYYFVPGSYDWMTSFAAVEVPLLERYRRLDPPYERIYEGPGGIFGSVIWNACAREAGYIDFWLAAEDLELQRLVQWYGAVKAADPNHPQYFGAPQDSRSIWHWMSLYRRSELPFEIIGVGSHDAGMEVWETTHWARAREYVKNVAPYRPFLSTPGAKPLAIGTGEGQGGVTPEGVRQYYSQWMFDMVGGGAAIINTFHWRKLSGSLYPDPPEPNWTPVLEWMSRFLHDARRTLFTVHNEDQRVLILHNKAMDYSVYGGYGHGNVLGLANVLYGLSYPFAVVADAHVSLSGEQYKVDLDGFDFIFVPMLSQDFAAGTWELLEQWLLDPAHAGSRGLCIGHRFDDGPYFEPLVPATYPDALKNIAPEIAYDSTTMFDGTMDLVLTQPIGSTPAGTLEVSVPKLGGARMPVGYFADGPSTTTVATHSGEPVIVRKTLNGNAVFLCGFPLGISYNGVWTMLAEQNPYNAIFPLYRGMLTSIGLGPPREVPDSVRVYIADDRSMILAKERFGVARTDIAETDELLGEFFVGATCNITFGPGVVTTGVAAELDPYESLYFRRAGRVQFELAAGSTAVTATPIAGDLLDVHLELSDVDPNAVRVAYSLNEGTDWTPVAPGSPGSFSWTAPDDPQTECLVRVSETDPFRLRVTRIEWSPSATSAVVYYEANREVRRYYTRMFQTETTYTATSAGVAAYNNLGDGYYLFIVTAKDTDGYMASRPCRVWFYNNLVGEDYEVSLASYTIEDDDITIGLQANQPTSSYYVRLYSMESGYTRNKTGTVTYSDLIDDMYYFVATGREAESREFPPGGPARQFFYINTDGF